MIGIEFDRMTDFEKLAHANWYTKELKKKNEILENRIQILLKQRKSMQKQISTKDKLLKKLR